MNVDLDLMAEWLSLPSISDDALGRLGIDRQIANRAGGLAWSRITARGRAFDFDQGGVPAIIQAVWRGQAPALSVASNTPTSPT